jgi:hypothetical protein
MYLDTDQIALLTTLLRTFFMLPYSTDLDGKDVETLLRIVKNSNGVMSKRKELFDIIDGNVGYSVKTLNKGLTTKRVDLQEQRFCDVQKMKQMIADQKVSSEDSKIAQGHILLSYMQRRIDEQMAARNVTVAKSLILLKHWNRAKTDFVFRYWEEDFKAYIDNLLAKNDNGEIEWDMQSAGLHGRDKLKQSRGVNVRLLRVHFKHNQIFTDHDIPDDVVEMRFVANQLSWQSLATLLQGHEKINEQMALF